MKRAIGISVLMLAIACMSHADWLTVTIGRIHVQRFIQGEDMMSYLSSAGNARVEAEEQVSRIVEDYCNSMPDKCAALGIEVERAK